MPQSPLRLAAPQLARAVSGFSDPSRIVQTLPGVNRPDDWGTTLIVRGGSPDQTVFLLDGIPVARVNHYEGMRNDHAGVGVVNLEFVRELDFHKGPFAAHLPDRLSGVVEIDFRDGDTAASHGRLITDMTGA